MAFTMMKKIMNWLLFSCQHATELVEKQEFVSLSLMEKIRFKGHTLVCAACRSYENQSVLIEKMLHDMTNSSITKQETAKMDVTSKSRILKKLKQES
ncbi:MAG: hypothetical protein ACJART_000744 [Maribacter sp.]|jgi:hypothetical protein